MSRRLMPRKGTGNREVSRRGILAHRGDLSGAVGEAILQEGAHGGTSFAREREPKASDA
jgi:hypothetical protein